ncbi:c-type cytochrome [Pedobacter changchengzhani]|uniref:C-type cytochrome n=2 Tax=Pedobacter changchengzhani TaxID=2529274 RepID=A0A4R5MLT8_9SPHI|nr:c-type cytochrome [Pedobacter changchengzhani]
MATPPAPGFSLSSSELLILFLLLFVVIMLFVAITLLNAFKVIYNEQVNPTPYLNPEKHKALDYEAWLGKRPSKPSIWIKLLSLKPIEEEKDLVIEHAYDGIQELNNPVPTWFNVLFYGSIIFAAGYLFYYHVGGYGDRQDTEYEKEMASAQIEKKAFLAKAGAAIDETSVKVDKDAAVLAEGKTIFDTNCKVCHGDKLQGIIGPDLVDEYWLHGGGIHNIFKTIKYGVPEKGMVSWEKTLTPKQISAVANYILSQAGTNPPGAKEHQGEKYEEKAP